MRKTFFFQLIFLFYYIYDDDDVSCFMFYVHYIFGKTKITWKGNKENGIEMMTIRLRFYKFSEMYDTPCTRKRRFVLRVCLSCCT